jgi:hypothetical protein
MTFFIDVSMMISLQLHVRRHNPDLTPLTGRCQTNSDPNTPPNHQSVNKNQKILNTIYLILSQLGFATKSQASLGGMKCHCLAQA